MTNKTLSDKRINIGSRIWPSGKYSYDEEDVKDFIQKLKEEFRKMNYYLGDINPMIDKLAGDALIHSPTESFKTSHEDTPGVSFCKASATSGTHDEAIDGGVARGPFTDEEIAKHFAAGSGNASCANSDEYRKGYTKGYDDGEEDYKQVLREIGGSDKTDNANKKVSK